MSPPAHLSVFSTFNQPAFNIFRRIAAAFPEIPLSINNPLMYGAEAGAWLSFVLTIIRKLSRTRSRIPFRITTFGHAMSSVYPTRR